MKTLHSLTALFITSAKPTSASIWRSAYDTA